MRSGVPSSRMTRAEPSIWIASRSNWILEPADFKFLAIERAGLDRASVVVRDELADPRCGDRSAHPYLEMHRTQACGRLRPGRAAGGRAGHGIPDWESASLERSVRNNRLAVPRPRLGARYAQVENSLRRRCGQPANPAAAGPRPCGRRSAMRTSIGLWSSVCPLAQGLAACLIGCECGEVIIGRPARELGPFDRLELAIRKFQRFFG